MSMRRSLGLLILAGVLLASAPVAWAEEDSVGRMWSMAMADPQEDKPGKIVGAPDMAAEWQKPIPVSVWVSYTLVSDYIWRGVNFSEPANEGREHVNHQLDTGIEVDLGKFGAVGYDAWFEWYAGQPQLEGNPDSGHLQEVDHTIYYTIDASTINKCVPVTFTIGWIAYTFPEAYRHSDAFYTNELFFSFEVDDSMLFGTEKPVLNPYFAWYADMDDFNGNWWEFGVSHEFALADLGMANTPVLKDITVTPSWVTGIDHNFFSVDSPVTGLEVMGKQTRLANMVWGLDVTLDLGSALNIPPQFGGLSLGGFLAYSMPMSEPIREHLMNDEFYGGMTVGWEW